MQIANDIICLNFWKGRKHGKAEMAANQHFLNSQKGLNSFSEGRLYLAQIIINTREIDMI